MCYSLTAVAYAGTSSNGGSHVSAAAQTPDTAAAADAPSAGAAGASPYPEATAPVQTVAEVRLLPVRRSSSDALWLVLYLDTGATRRLRWVQGRVSFKASPFVDRANLGV